MGERGRALAAVTLEPSVGTCVHHEETLTSVRSAFLRRAAAVCALLTLASVTSTADADAPVVSPPRLTQFVEARDPRPEGQVPRASVELLVDVDDAGRVHAIEVARSAGEELDAAAFAAARAFVFEPATKDGVPVAARIRYEYVFAAREAGEARQEEVAPAAAPPASEEPKPVPVAPAAAPDEETFGASARIAAPPREPTKRTLERVELASVAGTRGDPLRGVELLPGVSRPDAGGGNPILRGANPFDTQVFLEGAPAPLLYHFGGLTSVVHARVLDRVDVYPSNFSVRYGRKVGGVIEARLRDPRTDGLHGIAELSLLDSSLLVETPIGDKVAVLAAARRSNIDAVVNSAQDSVNLGITAAPVYWDYQAIGTYAPTESDRFRVLAYGSSDSFRIVFKNPNGGDPALRGGFGGSTVFHRAQVGHRHRFRGGSEGTTELTYGRMDDEGSYGQLGRNEFAIDTVQLRSEWVGVASEAFRLTAGVDLLGNRFAGSYEGVGVPPDEGRGPTAFSTQRRISITADQWVLLPGAYVEAGIRPVSRLLLTPGVRADYNDLIKRGSLDPRVALRFEATETTAIKAGVGRFSQSPDERMAVVPIGNPDLNLTHAIHASAGVEQRFGDRVSASLEGFGKWIDDVVTATPGGRPPFFVNGQEGRVFGGEAMVRLAPGGRFFGFVSYTLMRSERRSAGEAWRLFDRDQPHILNATGVYRLGRGWEASATVRYTSGTPYTPVASSTYDATADVYSPRLGRPMSARNPAFSRVDLRVQKTWTFTRWSLAAYLDVQNALNAPNREGFNYRYDYSERQGARGLPLLPIIGLRGEL